MTSARHHPREVASLPSLSHVLVLMMEYMKQGEGGGRKCPVLEKSTLDLVNSSSNDNTMPSTLGMLPAHPFEQVKMQGQCLVHRAPGLPGAGRYLYPDTDRGGSRGKGNTGSKPCEAPSSGSTSSAM